VKLWIAVVLLFVAMVAYEFYNPERTLGFKITKSIEAYKAKQEEQLKN
jgi:hypothetical protein